MTDTDQAATTKNCAGCGKPMHLWGVSSSPSGWGWMHDTAVDEYCCWRDNRASYEAGDL
jgi:hypothetical protein